MLACKDSVDLFHVLRSTEIPVGPATFLWMPATLNFSKLKPLQAHTLVWYFTMGHLTMGQMGWTQGMG